MKIATQVIGIATTFFWIFLILFSVTAIYSLKDTRLDFGEPSTTLTQDNEMLISLPVTLVNKGYYDVDLFTISTRISDKQDLTIGEGLTTVPIIAKNQAVNETHNIVLNLTDVFQTHPDLVYNDTQLQANRTVSMRAAQAIPIQISSNFSIPWGAPLYNLTVASPQFATTYESGLPTRIEVTLPISFDNNAFFGLTGIVEIRIYDSGDIPLEEHEIDLQAAPYSHYQESLEFPILYALFTQSERAEVFFKTQFFSYGPVEVSLW